MEKFYIKIKYPVLPFFLFIFLFHPYCAETAKAGDNKEKFRRIAGRIESISEIPVRIRITTDAHPEAYIAHDGIVSLSKGILDSLQGDDELAFVIAHEISHKKLKENHCDLPASLFVTSSCPKWLEEEIRTDMHAIQLMIQAGFDPHASLSVLARYCPEGLSTSAQREEAVSKYLKERLSSPTP